MSYPFFKKMPFLKITGTQTHTHLKKLNALKRYILYPILLNCNSCNNILNNDIFHEINLYLFGWYIL